MNSLRISTPQQEGVLQVSKWLKYQALLDEVEMKSLMEALEPLFIGVVSESVSLEEGLIDVQSFLQIYNGYVQGLKEGRLMEERPLRRYFSSVLTNTLDALYAMPLSSGKFLIKPIKPIIQLQAHHFFYSHLDGKFHPMVLSQESVTWGIQFSYPQMCQDPKTRQIMKVSNSEECPNTALFNKMSRWFRDHTMPTPFVVAGVRTNSPIRLGKNCLKWISRHPQLKEIEIFDLTSSNPL